MSTPTTPVATDAAIEQTRAIWLERLHKAAAGDAVYESLAESIARGYLPQGLRLSEEELARWFEVSRTPVREALVRLESEGLAQRVARRGLVVSRITPDEILEVYIVRGSIDGLAARLATANAGAADRAQLQWINERLFEASEAHDFQSMAELNLEFHETLARASHNALLLHFIRYVHVRVRRFPGTTFGVRERSQTAVEEHRQILLAMDAGDADEAERQARLHMANAMRIRIEMLAAGVAGESKPGDAITGRATATQPRAPSARRHG